MRQYLDLLRHTLDHGTLTPTRATVHGQPIDALSIFGAQLRFNLADGFPAVTTKKLALNAVIHELIWFLSGSTNIGYLKRNNVNIWDQWADDNGELGPVYGKQWRAWQAPDGRVIDQIANVIDGVLAVKKDPRASVGRRLIVSAWNPADVDAMALPPCHAFFQFSLSPGPNHRLSCQLYQRSADLFLGVPFNIASYALLTHLIAHVCFVEVGEFIHTMGDAHIYTNHVEAVKEQLTREPLPLARAWIKDAIGREIVKVSYLLPTDIVIADYKSHPALKGEVAV